MNYGPVNRPQAPDKHITTSEDFELCYLRHDYLRRSKYNPTESEMTPYMYIVENLTKKTFFAYFELFKGVGLLKEDILNIGRVHLVSYLGLYSLQTNKDKKKDYTVNFLIDNEKDPTNEDILQKDRANFTCFLKQRMENLVRICRQKIRNVVGKKNEEFAFFYSDKEPPKYIHSLLKEHRNLGYRKLTPSEFNSVKKKAKVNFDSSVFNFKKLWYVAIRLEQKNLELSDLEERGYSPYENIHNLTPDQIFEEKQELRNFVAKNWKNRQYREQTQAAIRRLRSLGE